MEALRVVSIGGFGHTTMVLDEMVGLAAAKLVGYAPAIEDEYLGHIEDHAACSKAVKRYDDYRLMLYELKPDVAIVSTRLDRIPHVAMDAASAGCHIIAEKPLALDLATLEALESTVKDNGVKLCAMLTMRNSPTFIAARSLYQDGVIGEVVLANGRKSYKWGTRPEWFGKREYYGGTIPWVGIHALDFINFITDQSFTSVAAMQSNFSHPDRPDCQDNCAMILEMTNGGHATVSVDFLRPEAAPSHGDDWVRIVGTKGVIEANNSQGWYRLIADGQPGHEITLPEQDKMFARFLLNLQTPTNLTDAATDASTAFMLTCTCLAAQQAADSKSIVQLDPNRWMANT